MALNIKIEKNIPIPERHQLEGITTALKKMEIGDSFFLPGVNQNAITNRTSQLRRQANFQNHKFVTEHREEEIEGVKTAGVRVWRTEDSVPE